MNTDITDRAQVVRRLIQQRQHFVFCIRHLCSRCMYAGSSAHARKEREPEKERKREKQRKRGKERARARTWWSRKSNISPATTRSSSCTAAAIAKQHPKHTKEILKTAPFCSRHGEAGVSGAGRARCVKAVRTCRATLARFARARCERERRRAVWSPALRLLLR